MNGRASEGFGVRYGPHLLVFSIGYVVFSFAAVPGAVIDRFGVGFTAVGLLMSAALAAFVVVQPVAGRVLDDRATLPVLLVLGLAHAVIAICIDIATEFTTALGLRAAWGLVGGFALTVGATQLSRVHAGEGATRHEGIYGGVLTAGGGVAFLVTPRVVETTGWFGVHAVGGLLAIPALLALWMGLDRSNETEPGTDPEPISGSTPPEDDGRRPNPLFDGVVLLAAGCYVATLGAYVTLSTFVTAYFDDLGVEVPLNALALLAASFGRASGGFAVTYPGVDDGRLIAATTGIAAAGLVALAFGDGIALLVLPLVVLGMVSLPFGAIFKAAAVATRRDATALAVVIAAGNAGALVLPIVTGHLRDVTGSYDVAFLVLAALNALAVVAGIAITRRV